MEPKDTVRPFIDLAVLPDMSESERDFHGTSFFRTNTSTSPQLPTPSSVLRHSSNSSNGVVKFEHLDLVVKFGQNNLVRLEEALAMQAIKAAFPNHDVPVPEVFGWRKHGDQNFIYMSLIRGETLREAWDSLITAEKESICVELRGIVLSLREITSSSPTPFIGSVNGGVLQDRFFRDDYLEGPFSSVKSFNDWLLAAATRQSPQAELIVLDGLYREYLPDGGNIYFTHGDLTIGNIIVSGPRGSRKIVGIIDWEQAGWYPEYWEYCKLLYGVEYSHEWRAAGWADKIMAPFDEEWFAFAEYSLWRCP